MQNNQMIKLPDRASFFASKTLIEHFVRGAIGITAIVLAVKTAQASPGLTGTLGSLGLGVVAMVAFRGCPICWTIGFIETAARSLRGK